MGVILMILKVIGWIILSVLALVVIALFVKIRIIADYGVSPSVTIKWLFLTIPVFPMKKKAKKKDKKEEPTAETQPLQTEQPPEEVIAVGEPQPEVEQDTAPVDTSKKPTDEDKPNFLKIFYNANGGVDGLVLLIKELFSYIGSFFGGIFRAFTIDELMVDMIVTKSDAAQTAIYYGQLCSTVFPMLGAFVTKYKVKQYDFNITPDFIAKKSKAEMHVSFWFRPAKLIGVVLLLVGRLVFKFGFKVAFRMLKPVLATRKNKKQTQTNNNTESGVSNE